MYAHTYTYTKISKNKHAGIRAGEVADWAMSLPCKHEDLSSNTRIHVEKHASMQLHTSEHAHTNADLEENSNSIEYQL